MLKFSFGLPKRSITRLPADPQVSDLQSILTQAMEETDKDVGISWVRDDWEFKLVVRHRGSQLLWRLLVGSGLASQVVWSTNETNLRTVYAQLMARCNDELDSDAGTARVDTDRVKEISSSSIQRALSATEVRQAGRANKALPLLAWQREGELSCIRIMHLLQSLIDAKTCGRLTIIGADDVAELFFNLGQLVDAKASASEGSDTILEVLCWETGRYQLDLTEQAERQTISEPFSLIMQRDMELLVQANELEEKGLRPTSYICRQRTKLAESALEELMQMSVALKRIYLATTEPLSVATLVERVRLPRAQFLPALSGLMHSGLLMFWNEDDSEGSNDSQSGGGRTMRGGGRVQGSSAQSRHGTGAMERFAFQQLVRAKPDAHDDLWLQALSTPGGLAKLPSLPVTHTDLKVEIPEETKQLAIACFDFCNSYGSIFNRYIADPELTITASEMGEVSENTPPKSTNAPGQYKPPEAPWRYYRWRSSNTMWSLNCRARGNAVELYLVPARESVLLSGAEEEYRQKLRIDRVTTKDGTLWISEGLPVMPDDIRTFLRSAMRDLVRTTIADLQFEEYACDEKQRLVDNSANPPNSTYALEHLKQIVLEKQNLAQKIVSQQEEIQRRIARDLHDAVIADVTMLKRSLDGEARSSKADTIKSLEQIISRLREICYDLSPSDLRDWGLPTTIEALLDQVSHRTGAECELVCHDEIPALESPVELHIFRIIQEALNNSAKYSQASSITVTTDLEDSWLVFRIEDNGKGFDSDNPQAKATKDGGTGMGSMLERTQLIQCFYPAKLQVRSHPGKGTVTRLAIKLPPSLVTGRAASKPMA